MLRKIIRYTGFDDLPHEEECYFHLTKAELVEFQLSVNDEEGMYGHIQKIVEEENRPELIKLFKELLLMSYGKRSESGRHFVKNEKILEEFQSTGVYSAALIEILSSTESAIEFYRGILPHDLTEEEAKASGIDPKVTPLIVVEKEKINEKELREMSGEELGKAMTRIAEGSAELVFNPPEQSQ